MKAIKETIIAIYPSANSKAAIWSFGTAVTSLLFCYFIHWAISVFKEIDIFIKKEMEEGRKEN